MLLQIKLSGVGRQTGLQTELQKRLIFIFWRNRFQRGRDMLQMLTSVVSRRLLNEVFGRRGPLEFFLLPGLYGVLIDKHNLNLKSQQLFFGALTFFFECDSLTI